MSRLHFTVGDIILFKCQTESAICKVLSIKLCTEDYMRDYIRVEVEHFSKISWNYFYYPYNDCSVEVLNDDERKWIELLYE